MDFRLDSQYKPTGDQPEAIAQLSKGVLEGLPAQTLLGVTGSGKTFTMANVIKEVKRPTLILSHNKTLAAQLYGEFKQFFPDNSVQYFVSYYDYYQPEAYIPSVDKYIEKDLMINDEIEKLRLATTSALLSGLATWWLSARCRACSVWVILRISMPMWLTSMWGRKLRETLFCDGWPRRCIRATK